jgi:hypothetical protein
MPYALVPKDYTLKKVTTAQRAAVDKHNRHETIMEFAGSPQSGTVIAGGVGLVLIIPILKSLLKSLADDPKTGKKTLVDLQKEDPSFGQVSQILVKAGLGVPQTLQQVVAPQPARDILTDLIGFNIFKPLEDIEKL